MQQHHGNYHSYGQQQIIQHPLIHTIKTEDVDIKPSSESRPFFIVYDKTNMQTDNPVHELMAASNMEVDSSNNNDSVHGIIVTPEIVTMMSPNQMGKISRIFSR